jgi:MFS family permease
MQKRKTTAKYFRFFIHYFLGPLLFIWVSYSIYHQLIKEDRLEKSWLEIQASFASSRILYLVAVILLMVVNWALEAFKWKICIQRVQQVRFLTAFKAVLSGVSFAVSTPNRVGEYLGRVLYMDEGNRLKAISLTITGSLSQLIITLIMGLAGWIVLAPQLETSHLISHFWINGILYGTIFALLILTFFYFRLAGVARWFERIKWIRKYGWLFRALEEFNATLLLQLLSLSALRFLVFIAQYYLLFRFFGVEVSWEQTLWTVSVSFLVMAVIPTIALFTDLSLRWEVSLKLVGMFSENHLGIWFTSVNIWVINLIIPALAGSLLILSIKKILLNKSEQQE